MNKDKLTGVLGVLCIPLIAGFILLFNAVSFGKSRAGSWLSAQGGANTAEYLAVMDQSITVFVVIGGVLFAASIFGAVQLLMFHQFSSNVNSINQEPEKE